MQMIYRGKKSKKLEFILIHVVCHRGSSILFIKLEN